jgi:hypothetical protein
MDLERFFCHVVPLQERRRIALPQPGRVSAFGPCRQRVQASGHVHHYSEFENVPGISGMFTCDSISVTGLLLKTSAG